jgi:hypothetical protein
VRNGAPPGEATGRAQAWQNLAAAESAVWQFAKVRAATAVADLLKVRPGFTVETLAQDGAQYSDNPTFRKEFQRIVEGARKVGCRNADTGICRRTYVEARANRMLDSARIGTLGFPDKGDSSWPAFRSPRPA